MISVKGKFQDGVALPLEPPPDARDGQNVIITFLEDAPESTPANGSDSLETLLAQSEFDAGISDLAAQHDHYLYGTPKK